MPDLALARSALHDAAIALDRLVLLQTPDTRNARGRYERTTNEYQAALVTAYRKWIAGLIKVITYDAQMEYQISQAILDLQGQLLLIAQEHMPFAVNAISAEDYMPSSEAWRMIADAINTNQADIASRLIPDIQAKLLRGLSEGTDLEAVAESMVPRVASYAGGLWTVIQRLVGDFAAQVETRDDLIYRCRWVLDPNAQHCPACLEFTGEYDSYNAMLGQTLQSVPGYFQTYPGRACWSNCRCHLELFINGEWQRI